MKSVDYGCDLVVQCCRELVQVPSLAGEEHEAALVAQAWMKKLGYDEVKIDAFGNVIGKVKCSSGGPRLHFDGHLDTVPVTSPKSWQHSPFGAEIDDGFIFGRGVADMKGPLAAMICAVAAIDRSKLAGTITVSASVGEELLEGAALKAILQDQPADMLIIGEGTNLQAGIAQKGRASICLTTKGKSAHSSTPEKGINAVYLMVKAIAKLRALPLPADELLGNALCELTEMVSGPLPGSGTIPDICTTRWDRRMVRQETLASVLSEMRNSLQEIEGAEVGLDEASLQCYTGKTLKMKQNYHRAWETPQDSSLFRATVAALAEVCGEGRTIGIPYCSNGSVGAGELGIDTVIVGPSDPAEFHTVDEKLSIEDLLKGQRVYEKIIENLLARDGAPPRAEGPLSPRRAESCALSPK